MKGNVISSLTVPMDYSEVLGFMKKCSYVTMWLKKKIPKAYHYIFGLYVICIILLGNTVYKLEKREKKTDLNLISG